MGIINKFIEEAKEIKNLGFLFVPNKEEFTRARCAMEEFLKHYKIKIKLINDGTTIDISSNDPIISIRKEGNIILVQPKKSSAAIGLIPGEGDEIMLGLYGLNNKDGETYYEAGAGIYRILGYGFSPVDLVDMDARNIEFDSSESGFRHVNLNRKGGNKNPHWEVKTIF